MPPSMNYTITYYNEKVQEEVLGLPAGLRGRYFALTDRMELYGPHLGDPTANPSATACSSYA